MLKLKHLLLFFTVFQLFACGTNAESNAMELIEEERFIKTVYAQEAKVINYRETIFASGKLATDAAVKLSFPTNGRINRLFVKAGQRVQRGQLLAKLDRTAAKLHVQQAELDIERASIALQNVKLLYQKAKRDSENMQGLYQDSLATLEALQNTKTQFNSLENQLLNAENLELQSRQQQTLAQISLKDTELVAPTNGTILQKNVATNEIIGGGSTVFLFAPKKEEKVIIINITDKELVLIKKGDPAKVYFEAYPEQVFLGKVIAIAQMADAVFSTFEVKIGIEPTAQILYDGFIGSVEIESSKEIPLISIPMDALVRANGHKGKIYTLQNGKAILTDITIYKMTQAALLVKDGLKKEDKIIVTGTGYLHHEETVIVRN